MRSLLLSWFLFPHQNPTVRNRTKGVRRLDAASGLEKEMLLRTSTHTRTHVPRRPIGNAIHLSTYRTANYSDGRMLQKNTTENSFGECGPEARGLDLALGRRTRKKNSARNNGASSKVQKHSHTHTHFVIQRVVLSHGGFKENMTAVEKSETESSVQLVMRVRLSLLKLHKKDSFVEDSILL